MPTISKSVIDLLNDRAALYNNPSFVENDPVSVPHQYILKEDIEISAFFSALFAWGRRATSIKKANQLLSLMGNKPYDFIINANEKDYLRFDRFTHRTFQSVDVPFYLAGLKRLFNNFGSLEDAFISGLHNNNISLAIHCFKNEFFKIPHLPRNTKHLPDPLRGSAAKRLNMFLRWMVRRDDKGVDFGIWEKVSPAILMCPLDVHSARVSRRLGLTNRKQIDWKAVQEVSSSLREIDPSDPVRYDFALFGLGIFENY